MSQDNSSVKTISEIFLKYCDCKKYQVKQSDTPDGDIRIDISNLKERTIVTVYHTLKVSIQGPQNTLRDEMVRLKEDFEKEPALFTTKQIAGTKPCATRYDIMLPNKRGEVKDNLKTIDSAAISITENPDGNIEYTAKIQKATQLVTATQYSTGTLLLQGKSDALFGDCCDLVESICNPSQKEVISRFFSDDEETLRHFTAKYTPELIILAEQKIQKELGITYTYLNPYDQKWFIASECISIANIPLPEYSPVVMPACKAFEGFAKKLLVEIGLFPKDHFKDKNTTFSILSDNTHPSRKAICEKDRHIDSFLKKTSVCLDTNRNFMMHSDEAKVTKIESPKQAREKLDSITRETKEIFEYFNSIFKLL